MFSYIPPEKRLDVTLCQSAKIKAQNEIMNSLAAGAALVLGVHVVTWLPARPHPVGRPWAPPPLGTAPMAGRAVPRHRRLPLGVDAPPLAGCGGESQSLAASLRAPAEAAQTAEKVTEEKSDGRSTHCPPGQQCTLHEHSYL